VTDRTEQRRAIRNVFSSASGQVGKQRAISAWVLRLLRRADRLRSFLAKITGPLAVHISASCAAAF